jgi:hypothetical protein
MLGDLTQSFIDKPLETFLGLIILLIFIRDVQKLGWENIYSLGGLFIFAKFIALLTILGWVF